MIDLRVRRINAVDNRDAARCRRWEGLR